MEKKKKYLFLAKIFNPLIVVLYGILCFYIYLLSQYGGVKAKAPIIIGSGILIVLWILWCFYRKMKLKRLALEREEEPEFIENTSAYHKKLSWSKIWFFIAFYSLIIITFTTGVKVYESSVPYNGKLSWVIEDLKNKRKITFTDNNIYTNNIKGILDEIENKIDLPQELYLSDSFKLKFKKDGTISSFDAYIYGKDEEGGTKSFLVSYDINKSEKIIVNMNGFVRDTFNEEKKLQPFVDVFQWLPLEDTISQLDEDGYEILYSGVRNWGYNTDGIIYIDEEGNTWKEDGPEDEIVGYTTSLYVPGKEDRYAPARFIYQVEDYYPENSTMNEDDIKRWDIGYNYNEGEETFFIDEKLGYQLAVVDAALGSRFYGLLKSEDGGENWETINGDPYLNRTGVSAGITFIDDALGFIALSHSGGTHAELYRTFDGGLSYEEIYFPIMEVPLGENEVHEPFDFPGMPYEENGRLLIKVGQGGDGDYKGGIGALFESQDEGKTWIFIKEE